MPPQELLGVMTDAHAISWSYTLTTHSVEVIAVQVTILRYIWTALALVHIIPVI